MNLKSALVMIDLSFNLIDTACSYLDMNSIRVDILFDPLVLNNGKLFAKRI